MSKTILANTDGFTPVIDCVVKDTSLMTAVVFGRIWRFCQMENGVCNASLETIAEDIGVDKATVMRHAKSLISTGYLLDLSPDLRNHPHTYADTGKAGLRIGITAGVAQNNASVAERNASVAENQLKIDSKIDSKTLSEEDYEQCNAKVDAIIEQEKKARESWAGRERLPEPIRELADEFVRLTDIRPSKRELFGWLAEIQEWLDGGATIADVKAAVEYAKRPNGFLISSPFSLSKTIKGKAAERRSKPTAQGSFKL